MASLAPRLPFLVRAADDQLEPASGGLLQLMAWMDGSRARTQRVLAEACSTSQQRISQVLLRQARPAPGSDLAEMLALVTEGQVPVDAWLLPVEVQAREERRSRARRAALRYGAAATKGSLTLQAQGGPFLPIEPLVVVGETVNLATVATSSLLAELHQRATDKQLFPVREGNRR